MKTLRIRLRRVVQTLSLSPARDPEYGVAAKAPRIRPNGCRLSLAASPRHDHTPQLFAKKGSPSKSSRILFAHAASARTTSVVSFATM